MIEIPRNDSGRGPGPWWTPYAYTTKEGAVRRTAYFKCVNGHIGTLSDHEIAADGTVSPSVVCPTEGCGFHNHIRLEGWS